MRGFCTLSRAHCDLHQETPADILSVNEVVGGASDPHLTLWPRPLTLPAAGLLECIDFPSQDSIQVVNVLG